MEIESQVKSAKLTADILADLHSVFKPHAGQVPIGRALFYENKKSIMVECGRKFGKTDILCYALYRWAMTNPGTYSYYIAPWKDQIKDLVWANGRLPMFLTEALHKKYVHSVNNTEMRITFKNGSFIKCDGSDNYEKGRGYSATGMVAYDEFKDHNPNFHNAFEPNLAITDAPLLGVGTPAYENDNIFTRQGDMAKSSSVGAYFSFPSHMNPYISKDYLKRKEEEFRERGEYDVFELEYLAKRVRIGGKYIFPMLKPSMVKPHKEIMEIITRDRKDYDFYVGFDPGSAKAFAVGMFAIHRFDKHIFALDEIYATKTKETSVGQIVPVSMHKMNEINSNDDDWLGCYDNAAKWFYNETMDRFPDYPYALMPCEKDLKNKENKLSLIKDILNANLMVFSDRVEKGYWECDNYKLDDKGKIVKENDHWLDQFRYVLNLAGYHSIEDARPIDFSKRYPMGTPKRDMERETMEDIYGSIDDYIING